MTISGKTEVLLGLTAVNPSDVRRTRDELFPDLVNTWLAGDTGPGVLNAQYAVELTITQAAGSAEIDLQTVLDGFQTALGLTELRVLLVYVHDNAQHDYCEVSGGTSNKFESVFADVSGGKERVKAGGVWHKSEPVIGHVVNATHKTLKFTRISGGAPDTADLVVDVWLAGLRPA